MTTTNNLPTDEQIVGALDALGEDTNADLVSVVKSSLVIHGVGKDASPDALEAAVDMARRADRIAGQWERARVAPGRNARQDRIAAEMIAAGVPMADRTLYKDGVAQPAEWMVASASRRGNFYYLNNKRVTRSLAAAATASGLALPSSLVTHKLTQAALDTVVSGDPTSTPEPVGRPDTHEKGYGRNVPSPLLKQQVLTQGYGTKAATALDGYVYLAGRHEKSGSGIVVVDGTFDRATCRAAMGEVKEAGLNPSKLLVVGELATYLGEAIRFEKFEDKEFANLDHQVRDSFDATTITTIRKKLADVSPAEAERGDWAILAKTLAECQSRLQQDGTRQSWIDPALAIARERARDPLAQRVAAESDGITVTDTPGIPDDQFEAVMHAVWLAEGDIATAARYLGGSEDRIWSMNSGQADAAFCGRLTSWTPDESRRYLLAHGYEIDAQASGASIDAAMPESGL